VLLSTLDNAWSANVPARVASPGEHGRQQYGGSTQATRPDDARGGRTGPCRAPAAVLPYEVPEGS
jgi:hypothetical protein